MTRHAVFERLLARRDELTETEEARLAAHLAECEECRRTALLYEQQDDALRAFAASHQYPRLRERVLEGLDREPRHAAQRASPLGRLAQGAIGAAAAATVIAALLALVWAAGGERWPGEVRAPASRYMSTCSPAAKTWALQGPCEVIDSPESFRRPGVQFYELSWRWVQTHMREPHFVVRHGRVPPVIVGKGQHVVFSQVAFDPRSNSAVYAVSTASHRGGSR